MVAGLIFVALAVVGSVKTYVDPGRNGRIASGVVGGLLLVLGLYMYAQRQVDRPTTVPQPPASVSTKPDQSLPPPVPASSHVNPPQSPIVGTWRGTIAFPNEQPLRFVIYIRGPNDDLVATADSPDQNLQSLTVDSLTLKDHVVHFAMNRLDVDFKGRLTGNHITGVFAQHGISADLTLTR
jgi:hypothetical protein